MQFRFELALGLPAALEGRTDWDLDESCQSSALFRGSLCRLLQEVTIRMRILFFKTAAKAGKHQGPKPRFMSHRG